MSQKTITTDRDQILTLMQRLQQAGSTAPRTSVRAAAAPTAEDLAWVQQMQLPAEFFEYFTIERQAA